MLRIPVKLIIVACLALVLSGAAHAGLIGGASVVTNGSDSATIAVNVDQIIYTSSFDMNRSDVFGVWVKATSVTGTPAIKIELEESYRKPTTEGSGDTAWMEPAAISDVVTALADETAHIYPLSPVPMPYGRYKITGTAANPADTTVSIYNFFQGNN
jgi:hypothetical protein